MSVYDIVRHVVREMDQNEVLDALIKANLVKDVERLNWLRSLKPGDIVMYGPNSVMLDSHTDKTARISRDNISTRGWTVDLSDIEPFIL
ncbi:hypothetical protein fHeYen901_109 [Yersinia phage fHe-Yen9-01]|uniref:Uncharacterized protein n=1 Tax=Yersinia phage fHe-Yen9-01 TaxID=1965363 RepID=A0A1V0DXK5_9CAUD|nr:hypothetical protein KNT60_gp108 [Yersinia phage fHe-Yen9-01]ARB05882.1 hypothetical protein fHeYen901_109 [Yersinia phage fHe-Yen9-01]